ncbi:MAG TPA: hypothetical protein VGQ96_04525 [Candidatus Eremiobacteraceae bacterium]|nr:hypothetical protein [Candidatus Eremiobacteraceae bacterium]
MVVETKDALMRVSLCLGTTMPDAGLFDERFAREAAIGIAQNDRVEALRYRRGGSENH